MGRRTRPTVGGTALFLLGVGLGGASVATKAKAAVCGAALFVVGMRHGRTDSKTGAETTPGAPDAPSSIAAAVEVATASTVTAERETA